MLRAIGAALIPKFFQQADLGIRVQFTELSLAFLQTCTSFFDGETPCSQQCHDIA